MMKELGSLVIPKVDVKDAARYLCIGENLAGVVKQEINLIVLGRWPFYFTSLSCSDKTVDLIKKTISYN